MKIYKVADRNEQVIRFKCPETGFYIDGLRENGHFNMFLLYYPDGNWWNDGQDFDSLCLEAQKLDRRCKIPRTGKLIKNENI